MPSISALTASNAPASRPRLRLCPLPGIPPVCRPAPRLREARCVPRSENLLDSRSAPLVLGPWP